MSWCQRADEGLHFFLFFYFFYICAPSRGAWPLNRHSMRDYDSSKSSWDNQNSSLNNPCTSLCCWQRHQTLVYLRWRVWVWPPSPRYPRCVWWWTLFARSALHTHTRGCIKAILKIRVVIEEANHSKKDTTCCYSKTIIVVNSNGHIEKGVLLTIFLSHPLHSAPSCCCRGL